MDGLPSLETVALDLETAGFAVRPGFLEGDLARELLAEARQLREKGAFKQGEVGRGQNRQLRGGWRTDQICWLDPLALSRPQQAYWSRMEELRVALNRQLFLGLVQLEAHLAHYAPGGFYKPHLDRHRETSSRILSTVIYLDDNWSEDDGGQLRVYSDPGAGIEGPSLDVFPEAGKLVLFLSGEIWHEVRESNRARHSVTGWFRGPEPG